MKKIFWVLPPTLLALVSCGTVDAVRKTSAATTAKVSELSKFSLADLRPARVKVVEVREKDLKALPTGEEQAVAFESKRKRSFWSFMGPVDFVEPVLPEGGAVEMDGSLLPPKSH